MKKTVMNNGGNRKPGTGLATASPWRAGNRRKLRSCCFVVAVAGCLFPVAGCLPLLVVAMVSAGSVALAAVAQPFQAVQAQAGKPVPPTASSTSAPATAASVPAASAASAPASSPSQADLTEGVLDQRIHQLQETTALAPAVRNAAMDYYNQAREQIHQADGWVADAASTAATLKRAKADLAAIQARQASLASQPAIPASQPQPTATNAQQELQAAQTALAAARRSAFDLEAKARIRTEARTDLTTQLATLRTKLDDLQSAQPAGDQPDEVAAASNFLRQAEAQAIRKQRTALIAKISMYDADAYPEYNQLLTAQQDLARKEIDQAQQRVDYWKHLVRQLRRGQSEQALQDAKDRLTQLQQTNASSVAIELAQDVVNLIQRRTGDNGLDSRTNGVSSEMDETTTELLRLRQDFRSLTERVNSAGLTNAIGIMLRKQRVDLPDTAQISRQRKSHQADLDEVRNALMDMEDMRAATIASQTMVSRELSKAPSNMPPERQAQLQLQADLLQAKLGAIDTLKGQYTNYLNKLNDLDSRQKALADFVDRYAAYIDERILWIRSGGHLGMDTGPKAGHAAVWLLDPANWKDAAASLSADVTENPSVSAMAMLLLTMVVMRWWLWKKQKSVSLTLQRKDSIIKTFWSFCLTLAISISIPLAIAFVGWRMESSPRASEFSQAVGAGMKITAMVYLTMELLLQVCRPQGLAEAHFGWPATSLQFFRRRLWRLMPIVLPLVFIVVTMDTQANEQRKDSMGRVAFIVLMLAIALFVQSILRPSGKIVQPALARIRGGWLDRMRYAWFTLAVLTPLALAVVAAYGYYYTAIKLATCLLETAWLVLGLAILNASLLRWLSLAKRAMASRNAHERLAQAVKTRTDATLRSTLRSTSQTGASTGLPPTPAKDEEKANLITVDKQTHQFLRYAMAALLIIGGWLIWADVTPALGMLRNVALWNRSFSNMIPSPTIQQTPEAAAPATTEPAEPFQKNAPQPASAVNYQKSAPVTLADLLLALGVGVLTLAASKNIPGLMEMTVLQRLPWEPGGRYAFITILRYVIIVVGVVIVFSLLGVTWSSIQWLVAAITVGLGFGLQEIFGNFVSGMILLFERPMRVGDVVTVGGVTGVVSKIRIRATTITDFDRKELIVPNKEFITGQLVNWTLSDTILRVVIPVRAAFGTNLETVRNLLLRLARENSGVLTNPGPESDFLGFGESWLNFELRVFVKDLGAFGKVRNELQISIQREFASAGIVMPYPQRDIHVAPFPPGLQTKGDK